ncbi:MAG TPA: transposase [Leptospiraceae bacterium]|nr:transposase [Leptospiraceae bacterium]HNN75326.1 transposase [Leptospiraceae bacterium]HQI19706.1 transposase [Leptospiraceae bacterium]
MPLWFFGWAIEESLIRHPKVLTATEIKKRLGISYPSALFLKRRIQVLACEQMPHIKKLFHSTLEQEFKNFKLPKDGTDITNKVKYRPVVHADTMVLYSASQRANKGRKRHKHKGMTSAIYLSDKLGGKQIGTLVHVMGWQNGPVLLTSISDQKANTIGPLIKESIPMNAPVFTDEGYTWLYRIYKNHRMINHSAKGKDERSAFSCERWSKNGVHNQVSEGLNGSLKSAFRGYGYIKPEWSTMYLNEWSFFKNARYFGLNQIAREKQNCTLSLQKIKLRVSSTHPTLPISPLHPRLHHPLPTRLRSRSAILVSLHMRLRGNMHLHNIHEAVLPPLPILPSAKKQTRTHTIRTPTHPAVHDGLAPRRVIHQTSEACHCCGDREETRCVRKDSVTHEAQSSAARIRTDGEDQISHQR